MSVALVFRYNIRTRKRGENMAKTGVWISSILADKMRKFECRECGNVYYDNYNFCPFCGTDMRTHYEADKCTNIINDIEFDADALKGYFS